MKSKYDISAKDNGIDLPSMYCLLFELGLSPSNKGTIYLKELIEYIISNHLYDCSYKEILHSFIHANHYEQKNIKSNIKNSLYRINNSKAEKNFKKYLNIPFDPYYLSPSKFIHIIALKNNL